MSLDEKRQQAQLIMKRQRVAQIMAQMPREDQGKVIDEMPEWVSNTDRMVVKNLANSPEESIKYLQGKYPDADVRNVGGEMQLRKKGTSDWGRLDPSFSPFSNPIGTIKDLGRDVTDFAMDAVQGGAEALGVAGGAMAAGVAADTSRSILV